ncbi:MAG: o-succinylbenzoate--CoA ligase, partial [Rubrobacteraceae bacterium]
MTFRDLDRRVSAAARKLVELGIEAGNRVALFLPKDERYIVLLLAMIRIGAVACPISTRLPPAGVAPLLRKAACEALIPEDEALFEFTEAIQKVRPEALLEDGADHTETPEYLDIPLSRPATIVFTSGSSGAPKAALHTFGNHYYSALGSNENIVLDTKRGDRWLHSLPLYHVGGISILFRCLLAGAAMILPEPGAPLGRAIAENSATHVSLVATQLLRLMREEENPDALETLKAVLLGGGPVPGALVEEAASRGLLVHASYGLTEMASQVTTTPSGASPEKLRISGWVLPYREVSISGEGEILVRGETLFAGYVEGKVVDLPVDAEGWFHTGDLGDLDEDGYLDVRGRKDNLFISGGENVQPEEIEDALRRLDGVEDAVVAPVPDAEFGFRPVAFARTTDGAPPP